MKKLFYFLLLTLVLSACYKGKDADLVVYNAQIYTMDAENNVFNAMAIKDGIILETGPEREIRNKYSAEKEINAKNKEIYPSFHDAHGHIFGEIFKHLECDLTGSKSYVQMITKLEKYASSKNLELIIAKGWDQGLWGKSDLPNNEALNKSFPNTAVICTRVDGHAMLINQAAVKKFNINLDSIVTGGEVVKKNNSFTGILLDNAMGLINSQKPNYSDEEIKEAILTIQQQLLAYGISDVHEAGINMHQFELLDELATEGKLKLEVYAMLFPSEESFEFVEKNGHYKNGPLTVRSFKVIGDGALGSNGACLLEPYHKSNGHGFLTTSLEELSQIALFAKKHNYQVNTHCIGDSTNKNLLTLIDTLMRDTEDHRWRIEHAQIIHPEDVNLFRQTGAIPSVQPTHALSDMRWAKDKLGNERLKTRAYLLKSLLAQNNIIAFGTDFPVEDFNPFLTIHAAVYRKNSEELPSEGFQFEEAVNLENCIKAMTLWASIASFQEGKKGSLEKNKLANFTILDHPLNTNGKYMPNYAWKTFINGKQVFSMDLN